MRPASRQEGRREAGGLDGKKGKIPNKGKEGAGWTEEENREFGATVQFRRDGLDRRISAGNGSVER